VVLAFHFAVATFTYSRVGVIQVFERNIVVNLIWAHSFDSLIPPLGVTNPLGLADLTNSIPSPRAQYRWGGLRI